jgi:hypothetical protein
VKRAILLLVAGCGAGTPTPLEQAEVADYGSAQVVCVQVAGTKSDADRCRDAVKRFWCADGGALHVAGACNYLEPADGGRE